MSAKVTITYEHPHELDAISKALAPLVEKCKAPPSKTPYQHAYLWLKDIPKEPKNKA